MLRLTVKNLRAHKRRLASTFVAIVLGVSFLGGTLVLGDTMKKTFDDLFADSNAGTDVVVRSSAAIDVGGEDSPGPDRPVAGRAGRRRSTASPKAVPFVSGFGQLVGKDGDPLGGSGPPTIAANWMTDDEINPYDLAEGRLPKAADEVVIDRGVGEGRRLRGRRHRAHPDARAASR